MSTAFDYYFDGLCDGNLPAAVPILDEARDCDGMATVLFNTEEELVGDLAFSKDRRDRAVLAIYACRAARQAVVEDLGLRAG